MDDLLGRDRGWLLYRAYHNAIAPSLGEDFFRQEWWLLPEDMKQRYRAAAREYDDKVTNGVL